MSNGWLAKADENLLEIINKKLAWQPIDHFMLLMRQPFTWIPVYLFFLLFFYTNCRRYFVHIVLLSITTFALTDFTSATIIKPLIQRMRPCHNIDLPFSIHNLAGCGGLYSMPSSHASNHFGLSAFWFFVIRHTLQRRWHLLWLWALAIGYAQVYVGVHYPGDIIAGAFLGTATGYGTFIVYKKWVASLNDFVTFETSA